MALHSKWVSGNLEFYETSTTDSVCTISKSGLGIVATNYYVGTTGTAGLSYTGIMPVLGITVVKGLVTSVTT
jgi:hypothetical protein